jgi:hypothetical protein
MKTITSLPPRALIRFTVLLAIFGLSIGAGAGQRQSAISCRVPSRDLAAATALAEQIAALSPRVRRREAGRLAQCAYATAHRLKEQYGMIWPPLLNNVLVNTGIKKRGLCFQWAGDLLVRLDGLKLATLELRWGEAQVGTQHESNCIVVTAKGQPFKTGIVLDGWRHCGHLYWGPVSTDEEHWVENSAYAHFIRTKSATIAYRSTGSGQRVKAEKRGPAGDRPVSGALSSGDRPRAAYAGLAFKP